MQSISFSDNSTPWGNSNVSGTEGDECIDPSIGDRTKIPYSEVPMTLSVQKSKIAIKETYSIKYFITLLTFTFLETVAQNTSVPWIQKILTFKKRFELLITLLIPC